MNFFKSDIVRSEMAEIAELQKKIYKNVFEFSNMKKDDKIEHIELLQSLLDKQRVLYTRLSLSDDSEAQEMKSHIVKSLSMLGIPDNIDINQLFNNMSKTIVNMKDQIDRTGSDL